MDKKIDKKLFIEKYKDVIPLFKEEKTQNFTTLVLTLVSFSIFGLFAINPTITTIVQLKKQISDSVFVLDKLQEKINNLKKLQEEYSTLDQDILTVLKAIPEKPSVPLFTGQVHSLVVKNNLTLSKIQIQEVEIANSKSATMSAQSGNVSNNGSMIFLLDVEGNEANVKNFISSLVNLERIITIDTISQSSGTDASSKTLLSIRGKSYFKK